MITPRLRAKEGESGVSVMYNTVTGMKNGAKIKIEQFLRDGADRKNGISSMIRITGFIG